MKTINCRNAEPIQSAKNRLAYSLAAAAGTFASAPVSEAGIQYFTGEFEIPLGRRQSLSINGDAITDVYLKNYIFLNANYQSATVRYGPGKIAGFGTEFPALYVSALTAGTMIDASSTGPNFSGTISYGSINSQDQFDNVDDAYIGLSFPQGDNLYYAWIRVDVDNAAGKFYLHDWAFEDQPNVGIIAGDKGATTQPIPGDLDFNGVVDGADFLEWQRGYGSVYDESTLADFKEHFGAGAGPSPAAAVPEPGTLGLLAAGAGGVGLMRRRRRS